jgi:hypothetical protein
MHLSISNSRTPTIAHIALLLASCTVFCASVELVTAHLFGRVSRIESRRETEYRDALAVRSARTRHKTSVLVAGNSLLLHGVDFPQLQEDVGLEIELHRTVFENTSFLDWYYGLQRIFRAGAQPDVIVLVLSPAQLTSASFDGDYIVHMLVDRHDLMRFANDISADRNQISALALDNLSYSFGARAEIRTWILGKALPDLPRLTGYFRSHYKYDTTDSNKTLELATKRLKQLRYLCESHGTAFVLVIPPTFQDSGANVVLKAGASQDVPVLIPFPPGALPWSDFSDEIHLNPTGAVKFTPALAVSLKRFVAQNVAQYEPASPSPRPAAAREVKKTAVPASSTNVALDAALMSK